jgi:hypothetical protein
MDAGSSETVMELTNVLVHNNKLADAVEALESYLRNQVSTLVDPAGGVGEGCAPVFMYTREREGRCARVASAAMFEARFLEAPTSPLDVLSPFGFGRTRT